MALQAYTKLIHSLFSAGHMYILHTVCVFWRTLKCYFALYGNFFFFLSRDRTSFFFIPPHREWCGRPFAILVAYLAVYFWREVSEAHLDWGMMTYNPRKVLSSFRCRKTVNLFSPILHKRKIFLSLGGGDFFLYSLSIFKLKKCVWYRVAIKCFSFAKIIHFYPRISKFTLKFHIFSVSKLYFNIQSYINIKNIWNITIN